MKQFLSACLAVLLLAVLLVLPAAAEETADAPQSDTGIFCYRRGSLCG